MKNSTIELLDYSRYNIIKWFTLGWSIWFGCCILKDFINHPIFIGVSTLIGLFCWILWAINLIRLIRLGKIVQADSRLADALNDEFYQHNRMKAMVVGFQITLMASGVLLAISSLFPLSGLLVSELILYVGVLATLIALLFYNRNESHAESGSEE